MPRDEDIYVISDDNILSVEDKKRRSMRAAAAVPAGLGEVQGQFDTMGTIPVAPGRTATLVRVRHDSGSKQPLGAAFLSLLVCGAGQAFNGQVKMGVAFLLVEAMVAAFNWSAASMWGFLQEMASLFGVTEDRMILSLAVMNFLLGAFILANISQAYHRASSDTGRFNGFGQPILSAFGSLVIPGMGQLLNAQLGKALGFFACLLAGALAWVTITIQPFAGFIHRIDLIGRIGERGTQAIAAVAFVAAGIWAFSIYDAWMVARYRGRAA
ncbi:MAG TPA: hypothetical protein VNI57_16050 [Candidatus Saccharimonadales bacterium]|nr:hypothetical protein [Candidatus Saccharimonadales bacterium]